MFRQSSTSHNQTQYLFLSLWLGFIGPLTGYAAWTRPGSTPRLLPIGLEQYSSRHVRLGIGPIQLAPHWSVPFWYISNPVVLRKPFQRPSLSCRLWLVSHKSSHSASSLGRCKVVMPTNAQANSIPIAPFHNCQRRIWHRYWLNMSAIIVVIVAAANSIERK